MGRGGALALLLAAALAAPGRARAEGPAGSVRIRPAAVSVGVGMSATVEVWLEGGEGYYGVEVRLEADPGLVAVEVAPRWDVIDAGEHVVVKSQAGWCDDRSGRRWYGAWYAAASVSPARAFSGSGRVCAVTLTGLSPGTGTLRIALARGGTDSGGALHPATAGAALAVVPLTATPSATASPTPTPTPAPARAAALPTLPAATPLEASDTPRARLAGATATLTAACTAASPAATAELSAAGSGERRGEWGRLLALLVPFLVGAGLTAAALRLRRR